MFTGNPSVCTLIPSGLTLQDYTPSSLARVFVQPQQMQCIGKQSLGNGLHGPILGLLRAKKENSIMDFFEEENM